MQNRPPPRLLSRPQFCSKNLVAEGKMTPFLGFKWNSQTDLLRASFATSDDPEKFNSSSVLSATLEDMATFLRIPKINFSWSHYLLRSTWTWKNPLGTIAHLAQVWLCSFFVWA